MTLVVAVKCKDGVVMASDTQGVSMTSNNVAIKFTIKKTYRVGRNTIFGASGALSLIQRAKEIFDAHAKELDAGITTKLRDQIIGEMFPMMQKAVERHRWYYNKADNEGAPIVDTIALVRSPDKEYHIWHIAKDCNEEFLDDVGYATSGSGDVFMHTLLKGYEYSKWTVDEASKSLEELINSAIKIGAFGIGGEVEILSTR